MSSQPTHYTDTLRRIKAEAENGESLLVVVTGRAASAVKHGHPERVAKNAAWRVFTAKTQREVDAFLAGVGAGMSSGHVRLLSPEERRVILEESPPRPPAPH